MSQANRNCSKPHVCPTAGYEQQVKRKRRLHNLLDIANLVESSSGSINDAADRDTSQPSELTDRTLAGARPESEPEPEPEPESDDDDAIDVDIVKQPARLDSSFSNLAYEPEEPEDDDEEHEHEQEPEDAERNADKLLDTTRALISDNPLFDPLLGGNSATQRDLLAEHTTSNRIHQVD